MVAVITNTLLFILQMETMQKKFAMQKRSKLKTKFKKLKIW